MKKAIEYIAIAALLFALTSVAFASSESIALEKGERLTLVLADLHPDGEKVRNKYFEGAFAMAQEQGLRELKGFPVTRILYGEDKPQFFGMYAWPNPQAAANVRRSPEYLTNFKPLQKQGWNELVAIDIDLESNIGIDIDPSKTYVFVLIWMDDESVYDEYLEATQELQNQLGAKRLFRLGGHEFASLSKGNNPPEAVALYQWESPESINQYAGDPSYPAIFEKLVSNVERLEVYELGHMPTE